MAAARVLVVGAGFAGFECARKLAQDPEVAVTLVNPEDYLCYTPLLPDVAGGLLDPRHVAVPLAETLPDVELVRGVVSSVDLEERSAAVHVPGRPGGPLTQGWDRLVLTPGSVTRLLDIPGLHERARGLKTLAEALYLRDHLLGQLERSTVLEPGGDACRACRTIVVVGASYAGTELVAQLRGLADDAARHWRFAAEDVRFVLIDVADAVMPEVGPKLGRRVLDVLRRRGVDVRLGTTLESVDEASVSLDDGSRIPCRTVAWVAGVTASPLIGSLGLDLDHGRLVVTDELTVPGRPHVFAGGDAAAVPDRAGPGPVTPPIAQHAVRQGRALARNVAASLGRGRSRRYRHRNLGLVVDLGPRFAVANPLDVPLSGLPAKIVARGYHLAAVPYGANRRRIAADYLGSLVGPRPLVSLGLVDAERAAFGESEHLDRSAAS